VSRVVDTSPNFTLFVKLLPRVLLRECRGDLHKTVLIPSFYAKNEDAASALELKKTLIAYDRSLLVADPRRMEPKKFGGRGARARRQKVCLAFAMLGDILMEVLPINGSPVYCFGRLGCGLHGMTELGRMYIMTLLHIWRLLCNFGFVALTRGFAQCTGNHGVY